MCPAKHFVLPMFWFKYTQIQFVAMNICSTWGSAWNTPAIAFFFFFPPNLPAGAPWGWAPLQICRVEARERAAWWSEHYFSLLRCSPPELEDQSLFNWLKSILTSLKEPSPPPHPSPQWRDRQGTSAATVGIAASSYPVSWSFIFRSESISSSLW